MIIETSTLRLVAVSQRQVDALAESREEFARELGARVPRSWPTFPESIPRAPGPTPWALYFFVHRDDFTLIGSGGFKGPPRDAQVEIGYEIVPEYRGRGLATEAAGGLLEFAFNADDVTAVVAHTQPEPDASVAVLEHLGFALEGPVEDAETGTVWRWRKLRPG